MKYIISERQYKLLESQITDDEKKQIEDFEYRTSENGEFKDIFSDETISDEYKDKIRDIFKEIKQSVANPSNEGGFEKILHILRLFDKLNRFKKFLKQDIYLNRFKDKNGNVYIQARTSLKVNGEQKWISAYLGSLNDYPDGLNSLELLYKGKNLIRKKIEPYFNI